MASTDDAKFREIQLSGKELVFLFMAFVVIAVGIFLGGVQVGRGVRAERGGVADGVEASVDALPADVLPPPASARPGSTTEPVTAGEQLSYAERLGGASPPAEGITASRKPTPSSAAEAATPTPTPRPEAPAATEPSRPAPEPTASAEPAGPGFAIQVAAIRERIEADSIAKRLVGKGYPAYVLAPARGAPAVYRIRVGKYKDRREADTIAARLQKEEQFKPWIVR